MTIKELLIINHTHTDIGYTDYADSLFRQQHQFIDNALELIDREQGRSPESQFRWTCEVSAITADWFRHATERQKERFREFFNRGLIGIGALPVNWTPLISPANAIRSLKNLHFLRQEGISARVAIQSDVNGLGWFWTDLLLDMGVDAFLLQPNPHRGMHFNDMQRVFNWQAPSGRSLFTLHGWHYSVGVNTFFLGDNDVERTQSAFNRVLGELDKRGQYPFTHAILPVTNPASVDNGFATEGLSDFVDLWNTQERSPRLRIATVEQAMDAIRQSVQTSGITPPTYRGDWSDFWVDGAASTAYETMLARAAERLLPVIDLLASFSATGNVDLLEKAAEDIQYYDEHTWGAFCSVNCPDSPFSRIQLSWKTARAHNGFALAQEAVRQEAIRRAREIVDDKVEGDLRLRWLPGTGEKGITSRGLPISAAEQSYYVLNPSPVPRSVYWPVQRDQTGSPPQAILDAYITERYLTGMQVRGSDFPEITHVISAELPPFGEAVVRPIPITAADGLASGKTWIENNRYRLEIDVRDGSLRSLTDKQSGRECVSPDFPLGQMVYETLERVGLARQGTFGGNFDWSYMETITWSKQIRFARRTAEKVVLEPARKIPLGIEISVTLSWSHGDSATLTYRLLHQGQGIEVDTIIHKTPVRTPESLYICFGIPGKSPRIQLDVGDQVIDPTREQIPFSCETWLGVQGFAAIATDTGALVVASPDAPLVQPFGIQTENAGTGRKGNDPSLAFWVLNNHWDTNFAVSQSGGIPARFRLLPQDRFDKDQAVAFAETTGTAPVIVRAYGSREQAARPLLSIDGDTGGVTTRVRKAWTGNGMVVTLVNTNDRAVKIMLRTPARQFRTAHAVDPLEKVMNADTLLHDGTVMVSLTAGATAYIRLE